MRLKLDGNLSRHLKSSLEVLGHDVQTAAEEGLLAGPDSEVAAAAVTAALVLWHTVLRLLRREGLLSEERTR